MKTNYAVSLQRLRRGEDFAHKTSVLYLGDTKFFEKIYI
jgi:hypothetical protein